MLAAAVLLLALALTCWGHDYWLQPEAFVVDVGKPVGVALHVGDHFESELQRAYQSKPTVRFQLIGAGGTTDLARVAREGDKPIVRFSCTRPGTHVVALERDAQLIRLEAKKFNAYLAEEGLSAVVAERGKRGESAKEGRERYRRYLKAYLRAGAKSDDGWKKRAGQKLEIVPLADPTAQKAGGRLGFRVVFEEKPLAGVKLTAYSRSGKKVKARQAVTSKEGEATFALDESGVYLVRLVHMRRAADDKEADWHSWWAALTVEVR
jgi:uncharacterized GH25 family protein